MYYDTLNYTEGQNLLVSTVTRMEISAKGVTFLPVSNVQTLIVRREMGLSYDEQVVPPPLLSLPFLCVCLLTDIIIQ